MFILRAPYPAVQTTSVLPNPSFSDGEAGTGTIAIKRSRNGTLRTYVKTTPRRLLTWQFTMHRLKALELKAFYQSYASSRVEVTDHNGRIWVGNFVNNPLDIENARRANPSLDDTVRGEYIEVAFQFEGEELP